MDWIEKLSREDLIKLVQVYARNWLAHDGCWFLAAEEQYGLEALKRALELRLYAAINRQEIETPNDNTLVFRMLECRVQKARREKGLPDFPCKPVGTVEFTNFAHTVDERICTRCVKCPPDPASDSSCSWEFTIGSRAGI